MKVIITDDQVYTAPEETISTQMAIDITARIGNAWRVREIQELPDPPGPKRLTVGELKARLSEWPDDMAVLIPKDDTAWFTYVADVVGPGLIRGIKNGPEGSENFEEWSDENTGFVLPTLEPGATFDARDL